MIPRSSCDNVITTSGRRLVEFCKTYGMYIANARLDNDKNKGSFTYISPNECSLIDNLLSSRELFDCISDFAVETSLNRVNAFASYCRFLPNKTL